MGANLINTRISCVIAARPTLRIIERERPPCPTQPWPSPQWTGPYPKLAAHTASQTSAGEHLRLFFPRRPRLLCAAYPSILTPTHPGDGTDHRAFPFFTEVTEHEPYRPVAQRHVLPRRRLRAGNKAVCRHTAHPP